MGKAIETRHLILGKAFELIYVNGYQATSIDDIIATTQVTKGAFFYHFKNKDEMGLAVINELMYPSMYEAYVKPLADSQQPVKDIYALMKYLLMDDTFMQAKYGCPAGNLTQEMSPLNNEFSAALAKLVKQWQEAIRKCIVNGKKAGTIRTNVNAQQVAYFVMSGYWGIRNFGKLYGSNACYSIYLAELKQYLKGLE
jgi:AcrR family transcriptional regulator